MNFLLCTKSKRCIESWYWSLFTPGAGLLLQPWQTEYNCEHLFEPQNNLTLKECGVITEVFWTSNFTYDQMLDEYRSYNAASYWLD